MWKIIISKKFLLLSALSVFLLPLFASASTYGSNFLSSYSACSYLTRYSPSFSCEQAQDGNLATRWDSNGTDPSWVQYDLGSSTTKALGKFSWNLNGDGINYQSPEYINALGSSDGSIWVSIGTSSQITFVANKTEIDWYAPTTTAPTAYRYYRFIASQGLVGWGGSESLWEAGAYECLTDCGPVDGGDSTSTISTSSQAIIDQMNLARANVDQYKLFLMEGLVVLLSAFGVFVFYDKILPKRKNKKSLW